MIIYKDPAPKESKPVHMRWRADYTIGWHHSKGGAYHVSSGYRTQLAAARVARALIKEGSARDAHVNHYAECGQSIRPFFVCGFSNVEIKS